MVYTLLIKPMNLTIKATECKTEFHHSYSKESKGIIRNLVLSFLAFILLLYFRFFYSWIIALYFIVNLFMLIPPLIKLFDDEENKYLFTLSNHQIKMENGLIYSQEQITNIEFLKHEDGYSVLLHLKARRSVNVLTLETKKELFTTHSHFITFFDIPFIYRGDRGILEKKKYKNIQAM